MDRHCGVSLTGSVAEPSCYVNVLFSCVGCALGVRPYRAHCKWRSRLCVTHAAGSQDLEAVSESTFCFVCTDHLEACENESFCILESR